MLLLASVGIVALTAALLVPRWLKARAVDALVQALPTDDEAALDAKIKRVQKYDHGRAAVEPLIQALARGETPVILNARSALVELRDVSLEPLIETLANLEEPIESRIRVAWILGWFRDDTAIQSLVTALNDNDPRVRRTATAAIANEPSAILLGLSRIRELANEPDALQRYLAAHALKTLGADAADAIPEIIELLNDTRYDTRCLALEALAMIGPEAREAVGELVAHLSDQDVDFQKSVIFTLGCIGPGAISGLDQLVGLLGSDDNQTKRLAARAIQRIDSDTAMRLGLDDFDDEP